MSSATIFDVANVRITLAPSTGYFIWAIFFLSFAGIGVATTNLFRPYWTQFRASIRLGIDFIGWIVLGWLLRMHQPLLQIDVPSLSIERAAKLTAIVNGSLSKVFWFVMLGGAVAIFIDVRRILRAKLPKFRPPQVSLQSPHSQLL
jgi:hypothetical protein